MRTLPTLLVVLLLPAEALADKGKPKPDNRAVIAALEQQKRELQAQEKARLKQIDAQFKAEVEDLQRQRSEMEKALREKVEAEKLQVLKRVEERYAYILKYQNPFEVWGQLDHDAKVLRGVHNHLEHANPDYGGRKKAAIKSLDAAVRSLEHRLKVHHWSHAEKEATIKELQTAETDLKQALVHAEARWGAGTPRGMPESQARSNQQLAEALTTIDNVRHLIRHAQWEEREDRDWAVRTRKQEEADKQKVKESYEARLKSVDKEITQKLEQQKKELAQKKQQAVAQIRAEVRAAITTIDDQIKKLKGK